MHTYTVQKGESARSVAEKFRVSEAALTRENPTPFYEGQAVTIPVGVLRLPPGSREAPGLFRVSPSAIQRRGDADIVIFYDAGPM